MRLSRIERIFFGVFAVQLIFTLGFGIAIYRALTTAPSTTTAVRVGGTDSGTSQDLPAGDASGAAASTGTAGSAATGSTGSTGSGAATGTTGGSGTGAAAAAGSAATRGTAPQKAATVAPTVCPFANGQLSIGSLVEYSRRISIPDVGYPAKAFLQD